MADKYPYTISTDFSNGVASDKFIKEINSSSITIGLHSINTEGNTCDIWMKAAISTPEETTLDALVAAHDGIPDASDAVQKVKLVEELIETDGSYTPYAFYISTSLAEVVTKTVSFPFAINIMSGEYEIVAANKDDFVSLIIGEDTVIGQITGNVVADDDVITVDDDVLAKVAKGYCIKLADGTNTDTLDRIISVDKVAKTIKMETGAVNAFNVSTPTDVQMTVKLLDNIRLGHPGRVPFGEDKIGGSYVPANTVIKALYDSKAAAAKTFYPLFKYLY